MSHHRLLGSVAVSSTISTDVIAGQNNKEVRSCPYTWVCCLCLCISCIGKVEYLGQLAQTLKGCYIMSSSIVWSYKYHVDVGYTCMFLQGEVNLPCILQWRISIYITIFVITTTCSRKTQTYPFILLVHQLFSSTAWGYKNFILRKRILEIKLMDTFVGNSYENCLSSLSLFF